MIAVSATLGVISLDASGQIGAERMKCEFCEGEISSSARACKHCGKATAVAKAETGRKVGGCLAIIVVAVLLLVLLVVVIGGRSKPVTYGDLADDKARECIRRKGYGEWYASSGVTLEQFCKGVGSLDALQRERKDHPERY